MDLGLAGAAVCVQGGSKGMGRAAAECFAADGARVAVMARGRAALDDTVARLAQLGSPDAVGLVVDASDATSIANGFAELSERWGELNSLVCAVGPEVSQLAWDQVTDDQFLDAFVIGALSAVRSARAALPLLRVARWARIVNLAAMSARSQGFGLIEYTAAKAALTSITKNLSLELAADGILANTVSPGTYISDQMVQHIAALPADAGVSADDPTSVMRYISEFFGVRADLGRAGIPSDIAPVIFLSPGVRTKHVHDRRQHQCGRWVQLLRLTGPAVAAADADLRRFVFTSTVGGWTPKTRFVAHQIPGSLGRRRSVADRRRRWRERFVGEDVIPRDSCRATHARVLVEVQSRCAWAWCVLVEATRTSGPVTPRSRAS